MKTEDNNLDWKLPTEPVDEWTWVDDLEQWKRVAPLQKSGMLQRIAELEAQNAELTDQLERDIRHLYGNGSYPLDRDEVAGLLLQLLDRIKALEDTLARHGGAA